MTRFFSGLKQALANRMHILPALVVLLLGFALTIYGDMLASRTLKTGFLIIHLFAAGYAGYWLHKLLFSDIRPANLDTHSGQSYMLYRAIIVGAALVAAGMIT